MKRKLISFLLAISLIIPSVGVKADRISDLENEQNQINAQLDAQQQQMANLMLEIAYLEEEIISNQLDIEESEINLADAQLAEQRQFEQMCKRIQYNYEHKEESIFTIFLSSKSFSDFLNQVEYANSIYAYDSQMLDSYEATRMEIEEMKADLEAQRAALAIKKDSLALKERTLAALIEDTKQRKADVAEDLQKAREEAARRAREEAARRAAALAAARAAANAASANSGLPANANPAPVTNISGAAVVGYANNFVGGRYVWGGNSLTDGVDCSGFVVQVYKHFGIDLSGSRHSAALRTVGQAVSYDNMKAGDIICYAGHVGIYTGAGTIVEAQSSRAGITNNRSVNCHTILAIRRVI